MLPPESKPWGRDVDTRLKELALVQSNLRTATDGLNTQLNANSSTAGFLLAQRVLSFRTISPYSYRDITLLSPTDNIAQQEEAFDPDLDLEIPFVTSGTGHILCQISGSVGGYSIGRVLTSSYICSHFYEGSTQSPEAEVTDVFSWNNGIIVQGQSDWLQFDSHLAGMIRFFQLKPNTEYLFVSRRGMSAEYNAATGGTQRAISQWQPANIAITKIGK